MTQFDGTTLRFETWGINTALEVCTYFQCTHFARRHQSVGAVIEVWGWARRRALLAQGVEFGFEMRRKLNQYPYHLHFILFRLKMAAAAEQKTVKDLVLESVERKIQELERKGMLPKGK